MIPAAITAALVACLLVVLKVRRKAAKAEENRRRREAEEASFRNPFVITVETPLAEIRRMNGVVYIPEDLRNRAPWYVVQCEGKTTKPIRYEPREDGGPEDYHTPCREAFCNAEAQCP